jgi:hypothetical protein
MTHTEALRLALEFIPSISPAFICEASHHKTHEQHASNEPCPHVAKQKQVYEAIKAALETKDEPYAFEASMYSNDRVKVNSVTGNVSIGTPQRTWVGLTDEEVDQAFTELTLRKIYQAIEAKLKEKNT